MRLIILCERIRASFALLPFAYLLPLNRAVIIALSKSVFILVSICWIFIIYISRNISDNFIFRALAIFRKSAFGGPPGIRTQSLDA